MSDEEKWEPTAAWTARHRRGPRWQRARFVIDVPDHWPREVWVPVGPPQVWEGSDPDVGKRGLIRGYQTNYIGPHGRVLAINADFLELLGRNAGDFSDTVLTCVMGSR